ncbi:MAG: hypothetical protein ACQKBU_10895 [Verrucomicrobiales bacterium]
MKPALFATLCSLGIGVLHGDSLSQLDRSELIEKLDDLRGEARAHVLGRFDGAAAAFKEGMKSTEAATELYLRCVEKVDFIEREKKASDFRDWKKKHKGRLDDEAHGLALRHQLRWTILSMKASSSPEKKLDLAGEALEILDAIYRTPDELRRHSDVLAQSVSSTYFARAYALNGYRIPEWPMSPIEKEKSGNVKVDGPFELLIFPALRSTRNYIGLRAAWDQRIQYEEIAKGFWSKENYDESTPGDTEARERFILEVKPQLLWRKEVDLFKTGDEKEAALRLLRHLADNLSHADARNWEAEFRELVSPSTSGSGGES